MFYGAIIVADSVTGEEVFRVNTDGTSYHAGHEVFRDGISMVGQFPDLDGVEIDSDGIRIYDEDGNLVGEWKTDGTSYHAGKETFEGGIEIPTPGGGAIVIDSSGGIKILGLPDPDNPSSPRPTMGQWLPDGTSFHAGKETFKGGIEIPTEGGGVIVIDSTGGIKILGPPDPDIPGNPRPTLGEWLPDGTSFHAGNETFAGGITIPTAGGGTITIDSVGGIRIIGPGGIIVGEWRPDGVSIHNAPEFFSQIFVFELIAELKNFRIDHPLDPENKYLYHSCVEAPERLNVYSGNITTNEKGIADVILPEYFEALNMDFRYQLTVIGSFAQAIILEEVADNRFVIQTDKPHTKVSWQVSGVRHDRVAREHPLITEVPKRQ